VRLNIRVETTSAQPRIEMLNLAELGQLFQRFLQGLQGNHRHIAPHHRIDSLGRGVGRTVYQHLEDPLPLRRDSEAAAQESLG
jgi:hypothetical protein